MPFGPFILQWRAPCPNPPPPSPLPAGITQSYIHTPSGRLELLCALPTKTTLPPSQQPPPLFFAHGGFGCAEIWLDYMTFFASKGYPCYAVSYRGHGKSWYPGFWRMYFTTLRAMAQDLAAGIEEVERLEGERRKADAEERVRVVLVAHSAGGALSQYALSRGMAEVHGFCMFAAVPGFGSFGCYKFWALTAPIHFPYRAYHPRYVLANTQQVHDAFFTPSTTTSVVKSLERLLSPYESMLWPMQCLFRFVTGADVLSSITNWNPPKPASSSSHSSTKHFEKDGQAPGVTQKLLVLAAEHDVLCTPAILLDAAQRYRTAFRDMVQSGKIKGIASSAMRTGEGHGGEGDWDGVAFAVVPGVGHHLQNHVEWERGAEEILKWVERL